MFFFFKQKTAYEMRISDWSSDVCSSDLIEQARKVRNYGAAVVVMAFDEVGQADTAARKVEICERAYKLLTANGFPPEDIIFDPNIFAVATGIEEHNNYGVDFIEACKEIDRKSTRLNSSH